MKKIFTAALCAAGLVGGTLADIGTADAQRMRYQYYGRSMPGSSPPVYQPYRYQPRAVVRPAPGPVYRGGGYYSGYRIPGQTSGLTCYRWYNGICYNY